MDFSLLCRTCLRGENLNQIFADSDDPVRYSNAIYIATGVTISPEDGLPQNMCTQCLDFMNESLKFRQCCQDVQKKLLKLKSQQNIDEVSKIFSADEKELTCCSLKSVLSPKIEEFNDSNHEYLHLEVLEELDDEDDKPLNCFLDEKDEDARHIEIIVDKPLARFKSENEDEKGKLLNCFVDEKQEDGRHIEMLADRYIDRIKRENAELSDPPYLPKPDSLGYKTRRVMCKLCLKDLSIRSVDAHMARSHPGADERKNKCELCDSYLTKEKMRRHMKMVHEKEEMLRCGYCKTEFDEKDILVNHVSTCTAKKKKRKVCESGRILTECDICHKTMQKASLKTHVTVKHAGLGPVCEHCGRRFSNKFRLNEHYRAKHGYDKFKCSYCEFQSASIMALRNHERRHRGEKPFQCDTCEAKFHAAYLLAQHKQSHRAERLVKCDICPATFKANNSLHMHKLSCHSNTLYKCHMCARAYSCRQYVVKHLRTIHRFPTEDETCRKWIAGTVKSTQVLAYLFEIFGIMLFFYVFSKEITCFNLKFFILFQHQPHNLIPTQNNDFH